MKSRIVFAAALGLLIAGPALAADQVRAQVERADGYVRMNFVWPDAQADDAISAETSIDNQVLLVRFSREIALDTDPILNTLQAEAALARLDPDQRTLRIALRVPARAHVSRSYNVLAVDLLPPEATDPPDVVSERARAEAEARRRQAEAPEPEPEPLIDLPVMRASSSAFDRITFAWPMEVGYALGQQDGAWVLSFDRDANPALGSLRADPPPRLESISAVHEDGRLVIRIRPAPGAEPRAHREGNHVILDLSDADSDAALLAQLQSMAEQMDAAAAAEAEAAEAEAAAAPAPQASPEPEAFAPPPAPEPEPEPEPAPDQRAEAQPESEAPGAPQPLADFDAPEFAQDQAYEDMERDPETGRLIEAQGDSAEAMRNPVPESGVVTVRGAALGSDLMIEFPWAGPVRAAAFRRANAIWIVFDAQAGLDMSELQRGQRHVTDVQTLTGPGYSAARITAPDTTQVSLRPAEGGYGWTFVLAERAEAAPAPLSVERRTEQNGPSRLFAALPNAGAPIRVEDPGVGDTLLVVPAQRPARGVLERRDFLSFSILPSAHGLAVQSLSSALMAHSAADGVWITPPQGLSVVSRASGDSLSAAMIDFADAEDSAAFDRAYAAVERETAADGRPEAQIALARFLMERQMASEAVGALRLAIEGDAQLAADPDFRALRGAALAMAGRAEAAERDLSLPALEDDGPAQLWRGLVNAQLHEWSRARRAFVNGAEAIDRFAPEWRARFHEAAARTALALNDLSTAKEHLDRAAGEDAPRELLLRIDLTKAQWREAAGQPEDALTAFERLSESGSPEIEARAILAAARLKQELEQAGPSELIETLEGLRWRWRGDDVELETIRALGKLYVAEGRHREGLEAMNAAVARFPDHPVSRDIFSDMSSMFRGLFLDGGAERMNPVEAVALYFQFSELTPVGAEGDRMIRRLAERLVAFDLLPQAAELLQHQVDERLHEARARAQVAADLALIYLMDRQPERALRTLRGTRLPRLAPDLAEERRMIEARALVELDAHDAALDLIAGDPSIEAARLRADIAWRQRDWPAAGQRLEEMLGERWQAPGPLNDGDASAVLRAAVAWSLSRDREALDRLIQRYGALMSQTPHAAAFTAVTQELETSGLRLAEIAERAADTAALEAFLNRRRERLESGAAPQAGAPEYQDGEPQAVASAE